ncbi:hypothetical protein AX16_005880 [Volvariella volvacea WC 439]|nr:hypothetical protein AX16_005880 [Volvariella volvacea WC 439]
MSNGKVESLPAVAYTHVSHSITAGSHKHTVNKITDKELKSLDATKERIAEDFSTVLQALKQLEQNGVAHFMQEDVGGIVSEWEGLQSVSIQRLFAHFGLLSGSDPIDCNPLLVQDYTSLLDESQETIASTSAQIQAIIAIVEDKTYDIRYKGIVEVMQRSHIQTLKQLLGANQSHRNRFTQLEDNINAFKKRIITQGPIVADKVKEIERKVNDLREELKRRTSTALSQLDEITQLLGERAELEAQSGALKNLDTVLLGLVDRLSAVTNIHSMLVENVDTMSTNLSKVSANASATSLMVDSLIICITFNSLRLAFDQYAPNRSTVVGQSKVAELPTEARIETLEDRPPSSGNPDEERRQLHALKSPTPVTGAAPRRLPTGGAAQPIPVRRKVMVRGEAGSRQSAMTGGDPIPSLALLSLDPSNPVGPSAQAPPAPAPAPVLAACETHFFSHARIESNHGHIINNAGIYNAHHRYHYYYQLQQSACPVQRNDHSGPLLVALHG